MAKKLSKADRKQQTQSFLENAKNLSTEQLLTELRSVAGRSDVEGKKHRGQLLNLLRERGITNADYQSAKQPMPMGNAAASQKKNEYAHMSDESLKKAYASFDAIPLDKVTVAMYERALARLEEMERRTKTQDTARKSELALNKSIEQAQTRNRAQANIPEFDINSLSQKVNERFVQPKQARLAPLFQKQTQLPTGVPTANEIKQKMQYDADMPILKPNVLNSSQYNTGTPTPVVTPPQQPAKKQSLFDKIRAHTKKSDVVQPQPQPQQQPAKKQSFFDKIKAHTKKSDVVQPQPQPQQQPAKKQSLFDKMRTHVKEIAIAVAVTVGLAVGTLVGISHMESRQNTSQNFTTPPSQVLAEIDPISMPTQTSLSAQSITQAPTQSDTYAPSQTQEQNSTQGQDQSQETGRVQTILSSQSSENVTYDKTDNGTQAEQNSQVGGFTVPSGAAFIGSSPIADGSILNVYYKNGRVYSDKWSAKYNGKTPQEFREAGAYSKTADFVDKSVANYLQKDITNNK